VKRDLILSFAHADFRVNMAQDDIETPQRFTIEDEETRLYRRLNAQGTLTVRLLLPPEGEEEIPNPMSHFLDSVTEFFEYALRDLEDSDMIGITISNEVNVKDRAIGISFRRKDQITGDVIWSVFEKVAQSNARFNALDKLVMTVHSVRMPIGHGGDGIATKGRPLENMVHLKRSIVQVKAKSNFLAHALVIAKKVDGDPNYISYRCGYKTRPVVDRLLEATGIELSRGGGVPELMRFQEHFKEYRIVVFGGLNCEDIYFDGQVESGKRINLLYDDIKRHYHVINNLSGAKARRYVCRGKGCRGGMTRKCGETCSDCKSVPPCMYSEERVPCKSCNRNFRSRSCFEKRKTNMLEGNTVCEKVRNWTCVTCT